MSATTREVVITPPDPDTSYWRFDAFEQRWHPWLVDALSGLSTASPRLAAAEVLFVGSDTNAEVTPGHRAPDIVYYHKDHGALC